MVDLVDHEVAVAGAADLGQRGDFGQRQQRAGRVGRRGDEEAGRVFVPGRGDLRRRRLEVAFRADGDGLRSTFVGAQDVAVARVAGVGQQPFVTGVGQAGEGQVERAGGAVGDGDAAGRHVDAVAPTVEIADCQAQFGQAEGLGVHRLAARDGSHGGLGDRFRRWEVRFADFHVDDVATLGLQLMGAGE